MVQCQCQLRWMVTKSIWIPSAKNRAKKTATKWDYFSSGLRFSRVLFNSSLPTKGSEKFTRISSTTALISNLFCFSFLRCALISLFLMFSSCCLRGEYTVCKIYSMAAESFKDNWEYLNIRYDLFRMTILSTSVHMSLPYPPCESVRGIWSLLTPVCSLSVS